MSARQSILRALIELRLRRANGEDFQGFFSDLMSRVHGAEFIRIRPHGNLGDRGCDGYLSSSGEVFACYGTINGRTPPIGQLLEKIDSDARKANESLRSIMSRWTFVHNFVDGVPVDVVTKLASLEADLLQVPVRQFGKEQFANLILTLPSTDMEQLIGTVPPELIDSGTASQTSVHLSFYGIFGFARQFVGVKKRHVTFGAIDLRRLARRINEKTKALAAEGLPTILVSTGLYLKREGSEERFGGNTSIEQPVTIAEQCRIHSRLLVSGSAGSGKSTQLRLFLASIDMSDSSMPDVWFFFRASDLAGVNGNFSRAFEELIADRYGISESTYYGLVAATRITLCFDGLDECGGNALEIAKYLLASSRALEMNCIVTCRTELLEEDVALAPTIAAQGELLTRELSDSSILEFLNRKDTDFESIVGPDAEQSEFLSACRSPMHLTHLLQVAKKKGQVPRSTDELMISFLRLKISGVTENLVAADGLFEFLRLAARLHPHDTLISYTLMRDSYCLRPRRRYSVAGGIALGIVFGLAGYLVSTRAVAALNIQNTAVLLAQSHGVWLISLIAAFCMPDPSPGQENPKEWIFFPLLMPIVLSIFSAVLFGIGSLIGDTIWLTGLICLVLAVWFEQGELTSRKEQFLWQRHLFEANPSRYPRPVEMPKFRPLGLALPFFTFAIVLLAIGWLGPDGKWWLRILIAAIGGAIFGFTVSVRGLALSIYWWFFIRDAGYWPAGGHRTLRALVRQGVLRPSRFPNAYEFSHQLYERALIRSAEQHFRASRQDRASIPN